MKRQISAYAVSLAVGLLAPAAAGAQARVVFQVFQSIPGGAVQPSVGAAVCFSSTTNTRMTNGSGQATFEGIPAGTWAGHVWKSGYKPRRVDVIVPQGATVIPAVTTLSERSTDAPPCVVPRLGEERFPVRGDSPLTTEGGERTLDCFQFSQSHVMVGITGLHGEAVHKIRPVCSKMQSGGTLNALLQFADAWHDEGDAGTSFGRHCPTGLVVSGIQVTVHATSRQVRSATIQCKRIGPNGLTSGSPIILAPMGLPTTTSLNLDSCNGGRPARAIRAGMDSFSPTFPRITAPWIIATTQLFCEQPVVP